MAERGVEVDHTTVHRWAIKMLPVLALMLRRRKRPVGLSWRNDSIIIFFGASIIADLSRRGLLQRNLFQRPY